MASSFKKKRKEEIIEKDIHTSSSEDVESDSSESDIDPELEIQVEFEARAPEASDFAGIKRLLQQLLLKFNINLSEITELILSQSKVGSVIKCIAEESDDEDSDGDETYGITTVLNLNQHKQVPGIRDFLKLVTERCENEKFLKILQNPQLTLGWLINERYINIPAHIAPPLFASLRSEIIQANKKGKHFDFDYLVYMCKSYKLDMSTVTKKKKKQTKESQDLMFIDAEDELLYEKALAKCDFDITEQGDVLVTGKWRKNDDQMRSYRTIMLIASKDMEKITTEMEQFTV